MRLLAAVAVGTVLLTACGSGPSRSDVLAELADEVIVPAYERFVGEAEALESAAGAVCDALDEPTLVEVRSALADAQDGWKESEAVWVGPVMNRRSWAVIDWPISPEDIEELIADETVELDFDRLSRRIGADQRGLGAVEYVVGSETALDDLTDVRRCKYLTGIAEVVVAEAELLPADWTVDFNEEGPYVDTFTDPDGDGLDSLVNDALFLTEAMADQELGRALGLMETGADPTAIVEGSLGRGAALLVSRLEGLRGSLVGPGGETGLAPLLGDDLADRLGGAIDGAVAELQGIDGPLRAALDEDRAAIVAARDAIVEVQTLVATEVVSRLGVTVGFSDADGDAAG